MDSINLQAQDFYLGSFKRHHLFSAFSETELKYLLDNAVSLKLDKNESLFNQGEEAYRFYYVIEGAIKLFRLSPDGHEKVMELITHNQTFAEAVMFMKKKAYPVYAQAVKSSHLIAIPNDVFIELISKNSQIALSLIGNLSIKLHKRLNEIDTLTLKNATHRVVRYLMNELTNNFNDSPCINLSLPKRLIASRLSIQPETFSRIMHKLAHDGVLEIHGREIKVNNFNSLANYERTEIPN